MKRNHFLAAAFIPQFSTRDAESVPANKVEVTK